MFNHNTTGGLFSSAEDALHKNSYNPKADLYSILDQLEDFRNAEGKFHFKLCYLERIGIGGKSCNEWIQSSNPATESDITDFQAISLAFNKTGLQRGWTGLGRNTQNYVEERALIDEAPTHGYWFMAVGAFGFWPSIKDGTIPGPWFDPSGQMVQSSAIKIVELYVCF